jgi:alpha-beta hydrolase superfamily lysophospholipase
MSDAKPGRLQMAIVRFLSRFFPGLGIMQLDANGVSRDPEEVTRYVNDPLVYTGKVSARMAAELFRAMENVQKDAGKIDLPILMLHGGDDSMASPQGSRFLEAHIGSVEKRLKIYPGLFHEIFNEPEQDQVVQDVLEWCDGLIAQEKR